MTNEFRWTCARCGALLGTVKGRRLTIRHKRVEWVASLPAHTECRRCSARNHLS